MDRGGLERAIHDHIAKHGSIRPVEGVFGDAKPNKAYVQEDSVDGSGNLFYGCPYRFPYETRNEQMGAIAGMKRMVAEDINLAYRMRYLAPLLLPFLNPIGKWYLKRLARIFHADLWSRTARMGDYPPFQKAILLAGVQCTSGEDDLIVLYGLVAFLGDIAYGSVAQDGLNVLKSNLGNGLNLREAMRETIRTVLNREHRQNGVMGKVKKAAKLINLALSMPSVERKLALFLGKLDWEAVRVDGATRYFNYRRIGYDFEGLSYPERMEIVEKVDREQGIYFVR
jgi:hypothetical protein